MSRSRSRWRRVVLHRPQQEAPLVKSQPPLRRTQRPPASPSPPVLTRLTPRPPASHHDSAMEAVMTTPWRKAAEPKQNPQPLPASAPRSQAASRHHAGSYYRIHVRTRVWSPMPQTGGRVLGRGHRVHKVCERRCYATVQPRVPTQSELRPCSHTLATGCVSRREDAPLKFSTSTP